jgi:hypothetical protein
MRTDVHKTVQLGELVVAAFDKAAQVSTDPQEASRLAKRMLTRILRRARKTPRASSQWVNCLLLMEVSYENPSTL